MKTKKKANLGSILRLLDFLWKNYKVSLIVSFILIILSSLATVNVTASIQSLVDVYVEPMLTSNSHDFGPLLSFLTRVGLICLIGVLANYGFTLIMATVSQDSLRSLRNQLFARMQNCQFVTLIPTNTGTSCLSIPMILMLFAKRLNNPFLNSYPQRLPSLG